MGISPIPPIHLLPVVKTPPANSGLSRVFNIENASEPAEDSYSGSGKKSAGGQDDEEPAADTLEAEFLEAETLAAETLAAESGASAPDDAPRTQINYFA